MKSVLQSFWLLTVAFGDLIVVILASVMPALGVVSNLIFSLQWLPRIPIRVFRYLILNSFPS